MAGEESTMGGGIAQGLGQVGKFGLDVASLIMEYQAAKEQEKAYKERRPTEETVEFFQNEKQKRDYENRLRFSAELQKFFQARG